MIKQKTSRECAVACLTYLSGQSYTKIRQLRAKLGPRRNRVGTPLDVCERIMAHTGVWKLQNEEFACMNSFRIRRPFGTYMVALRKWVRGRVVCHAMVFEDGRLKDPARGGYPASEWMEADVIAAWRLIETHTVLGQGEVVLDC